MTDCITLLRDSLECMAKMTDEDAGALLKALINHANGEEPDMASEPVIVQAVYPLIKGQIDRTEELRAARSAAGKRGGEASTKQTESKQEANDKQTESKPEAQEQEQEHIKETPLTGSKEKRFVAPTVDQVREYCRERGNSVDPERFVDFYASKGWRVGNQPMKDWKAAVRTWEKDRPGKPADKPPDKPPENKPDYDEQMKQIWLREYQKRHANGG